MKLFVAIVLALVAASTYAVDPEPLKITRFEFFQQPEGAYNYAFETENGISRAETGERKEALDEDNKPHDVVVVRGSYAFTNPDGVLDTITYFADETGYHAEGASIPKEPVV